MLTFEVRSDVATGSPIEKLNTRTPPYPHHPIFQLGPIWPYLHCVLDGRLPIFITGFVQIPPSVL